MIKRLFFVFLFTSALCQATHQVEEEKLDYKALYFKYVNDHAAMSRRLIGLYKADYPYKESHLYDKYLLPQSIMHLNKVELLINQLKSKQEISQSLIFKEEKLESTKIENSSILELSGLIDRHYDDQENKITILAREKSELERLLNEKEENDNDFLNKYEIKGVFFGAVITCVAFGLYYKFSK